MFSFMSSIGVTLCSSKLCLTQVLRNIFIVCLVNLTVIGYFGVKTTEAASLRDLGILPAVRVPRQTLADSCHLDELSSEQINGILDWLRDKAHRLFTNYRFEHNIDTMDLPAGRPGCLYLNSNNHGSEIVTRLHELPQFGFWLWRMVQAEQNPEISSEMVYFSELINSTATRIDDIVTLRMQQCSCGTLTPTPYSSDACEIPTPTEITATDFHRDATIILYEIGRTLHDLNDYLKQVDGRDLVATVC